MIYIHATHTHSFIQNDVLSIFILLLFATAVHMKEEKKTNIDLSAFFRVEVPPFAFHALVLSVDCRTF